jgi:hypothetical protein
MVALGLLVGVLGFSTASDPALAAAPVKTTLKLSCERGVDSAVVLYSLHAPLNDDIDLATGSLICGTANQSDTDVGSVTGSAIQFATFDLNTNLGYKSCLVQGIQIPTRYVLCEDANGVGVTLAVR